MDPTSNSDLLATVSHELKTPLVALKASLELLSRHLPAEPESLPKALDAATRSMERMERLIADILDAERLRTGRVTVRPGSVPASDLAEDAVDAVATIAERIGVGLDVAVADVVVAADRLRISQVLTNLLSNAIKYSPPGTAVALRAVRSGDQVRFDVDDRGRGIPRHLHDTIFEPFEQAHADSAALGGTGLGLTICKRIVEAHGGRIELGQAGGPGAVVVTLPEVREAA